MKANNFKNILIFFQTVALHFAFDPISFVFFDGGALGSDVSDRTLKTIQIKLLIIV